MLNLLLLTDVFELCPKSLLVMLSYPSATPGALKVKTTAIRLWIEDIVIVLQENKVAAGAFIFGVLWYLISSCLAHFQNLLITLYLLLLTIVSTAPALTHTRSRSRAA